MTASWVPVPWDTVKADQLVRLENGDGTELFGTAHFIRKHKGQRLGISTSIGWKQTVQWEWLGWSVFITAPTTPPLPTEPNTIWADKTGHPWFVTDMGNLVTHQIELHGPAELAAPFTRLEPVATTAEKVIERVRTNMVMVADGTRPDGRFIISSSDLNRIAAEFGVTS